jgi:hypothetical protein
MGVGRWDTSSPIGKQGPTKEYNRMNFRDPKTPMGTLVLLVVFMILIIALWTNVYLLMLSRGVTQ